MFFCPNFFHFLNVSQHPLLNLDSQPAVCVSVNVQPMMPCPWPHPQYMKYPVTIATIYTFRMCLSESRWICLSVCALKMTNVHFPGLQKNLFHCIFIIISYHLDLGPCSCHCASMLQKKSYSLILVPHRKPGVRWCSSNGVIVGFWCSRQKYNQAAMCSQLCTLYLIDTWRWKGRYIGGH